MKNRSIIIFLITLLFTGLLPGFCVASITTIELKADVQVDNDQILLGEIAHIKGGNQEFIHKLEKIVIGKAPLPGKTRIVGIKYIKLRLKQCKINLHHTKFNIPEQIKISRSVVEISKDKIRNIVFQDLKKKIAQSNGRGKIKSISVSHNIVLPKGDISYQIAYLKNSLFSGREYIDVIFQVGIRFKKKIRVMVEVERLTEVIVTKRQLNRYTIINKKDLYSKIMDSEKIPANAITDLGDVIGKRTKRAIRPETILRADFIEFPPLVKRGDVVSIIAESNGIRITAIGQVKKKGHRGERLKVLNIDSNKVVYAKVLDANTVVVDF